MESILVDLCRLCAKKKFPDEIIGQISNESLDIESKLIACCQWNTFSEIESEKFPQAVCISCFQILQQCWDFAERIRSAQLELLSKIDCNVKAESQSSDDEDNFSVKSSLLELIEVKSLAPLSDMNSDSFDSTGSPGEIVKSKIVCANQQLDFESSESIKIEQLEELDAPNLPTNDQRFKKNAFLKAISKDDRNDDGTIKAEAVQRLGLDNWTLLRIHRCYLCQMQFAERYEWQKHIQTEHQGDPLRHLCNICNVKHCKRPNALMKHIISKHRRNLKHCCRECDTYFWDLDRLRSHLSRCSRKQDKPSLCDICGKEFRNESFLRAHRRDHLDLKRIYECVFCRKSVYNKPYMRHHIRTAHVGGKPKFKCDRCDKTFERKTPFNRHKKIHSNDFPFECTHCEKRFRFKYYLNTHIRTHTGEKPFQCILCEYRCSDSGNICKHMRQKHGVTKTEAIKRQ